VGESLTGPPTSPAIRAGPLGPFPVFLAAAVLAAAGALFEISYWVGIPANSPATVVVAAGILVAVVGFLAWGVWAPRNE
jgi:hypothetical protein